MVRKKEQLKMSQCVVGHLCYDGWCEACDDCFDLSICQGVGYLEGCEMHVWERHEPEACEGVSLLI